MKKAKTLGLTTLAALVTGLSGCATTKLDAESASYAAATKRDAYEKMISQETALEAARRASAAAAPQLKIEMPKPSGRKTDPRFDVDAYELPAGKVIAHVLAGSGMTAVLTDEAEAAKVSITLRDVNWREALEALRDARGFDFSVSGRRVLIDKPSKLSRTFEVGYLAGQRNSSSTVGASSGGTSSNTTGTTSATGTNGTGSSNQNTGGSSTISGAQKTDFYGTLKEAVTAIIGSDTGNQVSVNPMTGTVFVRGPAARVREVEEYIKRQEDVAGRQVLIETKIVEVSLNDQFQAGINWSLFNNRGNVGGGVLPGGGNVNPGAATLSSGNTTFSKAVAGTAATLLTSGTGSTVGLAAQFGNFAAMLSFLDTQGSTRVVQSPRISTLNNQPALLKVGNQRAYATGATTNTTSTTGNTGTTTTPTVTTADYFSGIEYTLTPHVSKEGMVTINVRPHMTNVTQETLNVSLGSAGTVSMPIASSSIQDTDTVVRLLDGGTAVVGGLMRVKGTNSRSGIPGVPCVGGDCSSSGEKTELVILLKATVIRGQADWQAGAGSDQ